MKLQSDSFPDHAPIPAEFAFGKPDPKEHFTFSENRSPHLCWSEVPEGVRSFAVICVDTDVPSVFDNVNKEGTVLAKDMPRIEFHHWVLVDVAATTTELPAGADSQAVTPRGKPYGKTDYGIRGLNGYTMFMAGNPEMEGDYAGYDGPCPPWNDERVHRYTFTVYALDTESLGLSGKFTAVEAREAMEGHVLGQASWTGTYTLNPDVQA